MTKSSSPVLSLPYLPILSSHDDLAQLETVPLRQNQPVNLFQKFAAAAPVIVLMHVAALTCPVLHTHELCPTESGLTLLQDSNFVLYFLCILTIRSHFFSAISRPKK